MAHSAKSSPPDDPHTSLRPVSPAVITRLGRQLESRDFRQLATTGIESAQRPRPQSPDINHTKEADMLVLTRRVSEGGDDGRENEIVVITPSGERITFLLCASHSRSRQVRIAIEAPPSMRILRGELDVSEVPRDGQRRVSA